MPPLDDYMLNTREIEQGVVALKKRQRKLHLLTVFVSACTLGCGLSFFFQQELIYSFFDLHEQLQYLHLPSSLDADLATLSGNPDYFGQLIFWFFWLFLKLFASFIGAFVVIHWLKYIRYFRVRFQSFVLKFVAWLIAFMLIWSGLTLWQHDIQDQRNDMTQHLVQYDDHIQQSEIAQYLTDPKIAPPVRAYVLAQTALLQQPADIASAKPYVVQLMQAEKNPQQFAQYGFKDEQLWAMQQQIYGKSLTPAANSIATRVQDADQIYSIVHILMLAITTLFAVLMFILLGLSYYLKRRLIRIGQRLGT